MLSQSPGEPAANASGDRTGLGRVLGAEASEAIALERECPLQGAKKCSVVHGYDSEAGFELANLNLRSGQLKIDRVVAHELMLYLGQPNWPQKCFALYSSSFRTTSFERGRVGSVQVDRLPEFIEEAFGDPFRLTGESSDLP